jgi:hypothetical protein
VDWILLEFRTGTGPETAVDTSAVILKADGSVVAPSGGSVTLPSGLNGSYYVVVRHWNHVSAMSSAAVDFSGGTGVWDFATALGQAYSGGAAPLKALSDGPFGLFSCDATADGFVTAPDFNVWNSATTAGATGYHAADCNLDGFVTAPDFNLWNANTTAGASSQVPD